MLKNITNLISIFTVITIFSSTTAYAKLYKWKDENGEVHYGSSIPPRYSQKGNIEFSKGGVATKENKRALNADEIAQVEKSKQDRIIARKNTRIQREKNQRLLNSFKSVDQIILTRDGKINNLENRIRIAKSNLDRLSESLAMKNLRVNKANEMGHKIPADLTKSIQQINRKIRNNEYSIEQYQKQQSRIRLNYSDKMKRFVELTTKKR